MVGKPEFGDFQIKVSNRENSVEIIIVIIMDLSTMLEIIVDAIIVSSILKIKENLE